MIVNELDVVGQEVAMPKLPVEKGPMDSGNQIYQLPQQPGFWPVGHAHELLTVTTEQRSL